MGEVKFENNNNNNNNGNNNNNLLLIGRKYLYEYIQMRLNENTWYFLLIGFSFKQK